MTSILVLMIANFTGTGLSSLNEARSDFQNGTLENLTLKSEGLSLNLNRTMINGWTPRLPGLSPRCGYGMAYDRSNSELILFGGNAGGDTCLNDTWIYNLTRNQWTDMSPQTSPPARCFPAMAYVSEHCEVILFGGRVTTAEVFGDT